MKCVTVWCSVMQFHMYDMTPPYVWHDAFICVTWLLHMCDMTRVRCRIQSDTLHTVKKKQKQHKHNYCNNEPWQPCVAACCSVKQCVAVRCSALQCSLQCSLHCSLQCVTWLLHMCDMTHATWHLAHGRTEAAAAWEWNQEPWQPCVAVCCSGSALQCVAMHCSALQRALQCVAVCVAVRCSALQCVAVRCSALQCVAELHVTPSHVWHDSFIFVTWLMQPDTLHTVKKKKQ